MQETIYTIENINAVSEIMANRPVNPLHSVYPVNAVMAVENKPIAAEIEVDEGAVLVNRLVELNGRANAIKAQQDELKEEILRYARTHGLQRIAGADLEAWIISRTDLGIPTKNNDPDGYEQLVAALRKTPYWASTQDFSPAKLKALLDSKDGPALHKLVGPMIEGQEQLYVALKRKQQKPAVEGLKDDGDEKTDAP